MEQKEERIIKACVYALEYVPPIHTAMLWLDEFAHVHKWAGDWMLDLYEHKYFWWLCELRFMFCRIAALHKDDYKE